ncbi:hypothetical protein ANCCEY_00545 [Ancylostoma ceylanicum]|uniref:Sulfotransferase domain-containing protein n=1 Tax=Ancylostoma ceylanicum TaxID=53326 RepID=A0A0D6MA60_9BILA|nr:hypothetical protein ANCCEY_00545 [Ancylostoma ceylanicum]
MSLHDLVLTFLIFLATSLFLDHVGYLSTISEHSVEEATENSSLPVAQKSHFDEILYKITTNTLDTAPFITELLVPPFHDYWSVYVTSPAYNLSTCLVEKTMTTLRSAIMCYLSFHDEFIGNNRTISTETHNTRYCYEDNTFLNFTEAQASIVGNETLFSVVRHPIDRFLSGYVDKCVRYCEYGHNLNNYILVKYSPETEEIVRQLDAVFEKAGVPESYRGEIASETRKQKSNNSTAEMTYRKKVQRHLLSDEKTFRRLIQIYYYDFVLPCVKC